MPISCVLQEPSRLKEEQILQLLDFWYDRQESGAVPLEFRAYRIKDGSFLDSKEAIFRAGKRKRDEEDSSDEDLKARSKKKSARSRSKRGDTSAAGRSRGRARGQPRQSKSTRKTKGKYKAKGTDEDTTSPSSEGERFEFPSEESSSEEEDDTSTKVKTPSSQTFPKSSLKPGWTAPPSNPPTSPQVSPNPQALGVPARAALPKPSPRREPLVLPGVGKPAENSRTVEEKSMPTALSKKRQKGRPAGPVGFSGPNNTVQGKGEVRGVSEDEIIPEGAKYGPPRNKRKISTPTPSSVHPSPSNALQCSSNKLTKQSTGPELVR